jgi:hypothetical protein
VALRAQPVHGAVDEARPSRLARGMQHALREPHVEVHVEFRERAFDLRQLQRVRVIARGDELLVGRQAQDVRTRLEHATTELRHVLARVTALGRGLALYRGQHGGAEAVHLHAGIVDVELARQRRARELQHPADAVAQRGPAGVADVQRARGVRAHELEVDRVADLRVVAAVVDARLDDRLRESARGSRLDADVDEARSRHLDRRDAVGRGELLGDLPRQLVRVRTETLGDLHGDAAGPVTMIAVPWTFQHNVGGAENERFLRASPRGDRRDDGEESGGETLCHPGDHPRRNARTFASGISQARRQSAS